MISGSERDRALFSMEELGKVDLACELLPFCPRPPRPDEGPSLVGSLFGEYSTRDCGRDMELPASLATPDLGGVSLYLRLAPYVTLTVVFGVEGSPNITPPSRSVSD